MTSEMTLIQRIFYPCDEIKNALLEEMNRLQKLIRDDKAAEIGYTSSMIENTLPSYKAYLIELILQSNTPINPLDAMENFIKNRCETRLRFDNSAYSAAVRELRSLYYVNNCSHRCEGSACDRRKEIRIM